MKRVLILSVLTLGITTLAHAQATRTWVSGVGDDANPCSRTAPCKTFAGAISKTASPGIINCLDPGGFGAVTITKSITIDCTGTYGSVLASGTQGIVINALTTDKIVLRAIDINGAGTTLGTNGVNIIQAGGVNLHTVNIASFSGAGVETSNTSNSISVIISDSQILNIGAQGVLANSTTPGVGTFMIDRTHISRCNNAVDVAQSNYASISNSYLDQSTQGLLVEQTGGSAAVEGTSIVHNSNGIFAGLSTFTPTVRLSRCLITNNTTNAITGTGTTKCFGNNVIDGNSGNENCTLTGQTQK